MGKYVLMTNMTGTQKLNAKQNLLVSEYLDNIGSNSLEIHTPFGKQTTAGTGLKGSTYSQFFSTCYF